MLLLGVFVNVNILIAVSCQSEHHIDLLRVLCITNLEDGAVADIVYVELLSFRYVLGGGP